MRHMFLALLIVCGTASFVQAELFPDSGPPGATVTIGGAAFGEFVSTAENRVDFNGRAGVDSTLGTGPGHGQGAAGRQEW